ncbi:hypothetical protein V8F33_006127 [Rhypophila sp. PSN 637]
MNESESEEEVSVEVGEKSDSDVSAGVGLDSDSEEDFADGAGLNALKETVWRQKITSCPEYDIIAKLMAEDDKSASVEETINAIVEMTKDCLQNRLLWAIHAHIAPVVEPFYTPVWKNKGLAKIPEPLVQAACLWLNYAGDTLWEWAVKTDDWERRRGIHPDEIEERERNKKLSDANEALLAETLTRMHRAIKTGPQPDKTIDWETAYKERMEWINRWNQKKSDQDEDVHYSSASYDPEEDLDPVSPTFNRHAFDQRHFSGPAHEKGRVKGKIRKQKVRDTGS